MDKKYQHSISSLEKDKKSKGFTLIELVMVLVILSVLTIGINMFMNPISDLMVYRKFSEGPADEGRVALKRMIREISEIRDPQSISAASSSQLTFVNMSNQNMAFSLSSGNLLRNNVALAKNVSALQFQYWNADGTLLASPTLSPETDISRIQVLLTVTVGADSASFRSQVRPRNLFS